jgi:glycerol kinase
MVDKPFILALDQGTTSSRSILFDRNGKIIASASEEFRQIYPQAAWVEHDPEDIWQSQLRTAQRVLEESGTSPDQVAAIGITNQRETTILWDRANGKPIHNAIVWQCRRTSPMCDELKEAGHADLFQRKTGLIIDAYFSATKAAWLLDQVSGARKRAERGELCFGTVDSWLLYKLTGLHQTEPTNACRTMMYNIHEHQWDDELLDILRVPRAILPEVKPTSHVFGETTVLGGSIPVAAMAGDQQAALFGQTAFERGECKNTYGTGCFLVLNTGDEPVKSHHGLLTTVAWDLDGKVEYALEGSIFIAGAVIQWLRDELKLIDNAAESETVAREVEDSHGVSIVPAFVGLGAPHWDSKARGAITGLTRGANRAHIVRAALESIALQSADVLRCMESDTGVPIRQLKVDGGASVNDLLMQYQADILNIEVVRGKVSETTALGAAFLAGLATGVWDRRESLRGLWEVDRGFSPSWNERRRQEAINAWQKAVEMVKL